MPMSPAERQRRLEQLKAEKQALNANKGPEVDPFTSARKAARREMKKESMDSQMPVVRPPAKPATQTTAPARESTMQQMLKGGFRAKQLQAAEEAALNPSRKKRGY